MRRCVGASYNVLAIFIESELLTMDLRKGTSIKYVRRERGRRGYMDDLAQTGREGRGLCSIFCVHT